MLAPFLDLKPTREQTQVQSCALLVVRQQAAGQLENEQHSPPRGGQQYIWLTWPLIENRSLDKPRITRIERI
jgi:hypothetical protein